MRPSEREVSRGHSSGLPRKPQKGKLATRQDYARIKFKPWKPTSRAKQSLSGENANRWGVVARLAYATMLMPREKLIAMHATTDHDQIDELMSELLQVGEDLKDTAQMLESAYVRILATACAHAVAGGKFPSTSA